MMKIGLIGDYDADVTAHRAIPAAIEIAANELDHEFSIEWFNLTRVRRLQKLVSRTGRGRRRWMGR